MAEARALQNDLILREIFLFSYGAGCVVGRSTIAHCARVCKTFNDPALSVLWRELHSLWPLLLTLRNTFQVRKDPHRGRRYELSGGMFTIFSDEWLRLEYYARKVRIFKFNDQEVSRSLLKQLLRHSASQPFLPMLKQLKLSIDKHDPEILLLLSKSLRELDLSFFPSDDDCGIVMKDYRSVRRTLETLQFFAPSLKTLTLSGVRLSPEAISGFKNLQNLDIRSNICSEEVLHACAAMDGLESLTISAYPSLDGVTPSTGFRSLRNLHIHGNASPAAAILRAIVPVCLQSLSINTRLGYVSCKEQVSILFDAIVQSSAMLSTLDIKLDVCPSSNNRVKLLDWIYPLFRLEELRTFAFSVDLDVYPMTHQDVHNMAVAWPKITKLALRCTVEHRTPATPISAFVELARHCPDLRELSLFVADCQRSSPLEPCPTGSPLPLCHGLERLYIKFTGNPDREPYGHFLDKVFPKASGSTTCRV